MEPPIEWLYTSFDLWFIFVSVLASIFQIAKCVEDYCNYCEAKWDHKEQMNRHKELLEAYSKLLRPIK